MFTESLDWTTVGWIVMGITLLTGLNSTWFFLGRLRVGLTGWLMLNSCAPSIFLFAAGYLLRSPLVMAAGALWMFRYGTLGLFVFPWKSPTDLLVQFGHGMMTLSVIYTLVMVIQQGVWRSALAGLVLGGALLALFMAAQAAWFKAHPGTMEALFSGTLAPQE